jgi:hypothetical protein
MWTRCGPTILIAGAVLGAKSTVADSGGLDEAEPVTATQDVRQPIQSWRVAAVTGDRTGLAVLVRADSLHPHLQEAGEVILATAEDDPSAYADICTDLAARLTDRARVGDGELAELLVAIVDGKPSNRRRIRADLDDLSGLLEGGLDMGFGGVLDCETGSAWPEVVLDDWAGGEAQPDPDNDPDRYLCVPNEGSREAWEDMREFAGQVHDRVLRDRLLDAINGGGGFSRFKRILDDQESMRAAWFVYSTEMRVGRARRWLADEGFDALPARR